MTDPVATAPAPAPRYWLTTRTRASKLAMIGAGALILVLALLPLLVDRGPLQSLFFVLTMLALAQYWNLLAGYAGLVSVGQQAFVGLGGYFLFALSTFAGVDPVAAVPLAGLIAAIVALPSAWLVFRLQGAYFAIGTWVLAEVFRLSLAQVKPLGGGTGTSLSKAVADGSVLVRAIADLTGLRSAAARDVAAYWLALAVFATALVYGLLRSRRGLALAAIRDDPAPAGSLGVDPFRLKLMVYVLAAFGTGMVGALIYLQKARISPDAAFSVVDWTAYVLFIVIIGGVATIEVRVAGAIGELRRRLFDPARRDRDHRDGVFPQGPVGLLRRAFRHQPLSGPPQFANPLLRAENGALGAIGSPKAPRALAPILVEMINGRRFPAWKPA
jgi:branched-chain amino acid transport system permease protein